jgi:Transglutaminase-like superfamily/Domain of unknown function (DUF4129)
VLPGTWSLDDARWVLGRQELTTFLPWAVIGGAAWGMYGAKVGWGRWTTHVLGAVVAAIVVPIFVGTVLPGSGDSPATWFRATADSATDAILDFTVRNQTTTAQLGHHLLIFGLICWATGQFAGFAALGHRRPLGAVFITGLVLLTNMSITVRHQLPFLVIFSCAALLLLVRVHADDEKASWLQRRIGDPSAVTALYLRGGVAFVTIAILGSLFLTSTAASAPLAGAFSGLDGKLVDFGQQIQRFFPAGGPGTKISGVSFGPTTTISGHWDQNTSPAMTIQVPAGDTTPYYWKAVAFDTFSVPNSWSINRQNTAVDTPVDVSVLDGTGDQVPNPDLRRTLQFTVRKTNYAGNAIFSPDAVSGINVPTNLTVVGLGGYYGQLESKDTWSTYTGTALIPKSGEDGFTENKLRAASTEYDPDIRGLYLATGGGIFGPYSATLKAKIKATALAACGVRSKGVPDAAALCAQNAYDPYDLAVAAKDVLHNPAEFTYVTDVTDVNCQSISTVECFAQYKRGYCQYYATTMAMILRDLGVPARMVEGWLPGDRDARSGIETILLSNSHAWVEVYFPGFGWYPFDPTGNGTTQPQTIIAGSVVPSATPGPAGSPRASGDLKFEPPERSVRGGAGIVSTNTPTSSNGPFIFVALLLLLVVGLLALLAYQRGPRGPTQPETAWAALVRLAGRFGWAPRPTQTPFEYAGALGDILPIARSDLQVVASAKVEVAYGRKTLDADRLSVLRVAQRKLRISLLRLAFRRPKRKSRVRRI